MSLSPTGARHTVADYLNLPDAGERVQLIAGEYVVNPSPSSSHQNAAMSLALSLAAHQRPRGGYVAFAPLDVVLGDDTVVQPDLLVVVAARRSIVTAERVIGAPDLVVEILSPSTRKLDSVTKRDLYGKHGVREYWLVDPEAERVEVYVLAADRLELRELVDRGELRSREVLEGFAMPVADVFAS